MPERRLLDRSAPAAVGVSSRAVGALLDRLEQLGVECHSVMVVRHGSVAAEGWWAPYTADQPHLLYSLTKSFTSIAVGMVIADGLLSLDDRVVDVLPEHLPDDVSPQGAAVTVHHLLAMSAGHAVDSLEEAWRLEPGDLVKGFLRVPFAVGLGQAHTYDNATTFVLARMVEKVTGRGLAEYLEERLFRPMGIREAEWDRVASGRAFGFHGLHLTTESVAAFGELLLRGGRWGDQQLIPRDYVERATRSHIAGRRSEEGSDGPDFLSGYGYQIWMSRHGFHGFGAFGQYCVVVPSCDLVVVVTSAQREVREAQDVLDAIWECLLPGMDVLDGAGDDMALAERLLALSLSMPEGTRGPLLPVVATLEISGLGDALPGGTGLLLEPIDGGWRARFDELLDIELGHGCWAESSPLGRPVRAAGAWQGDLFVADLYVIASPHRVRLTVHAVTGVARARWTTVPLTGPDLLLHLRAPLMTRPDVA